MTASGVAPDTGRHVAATAWRRLSQGKSIVVATPLTVVMVFGLLWTALMIHTHPGDLDDIVAWASTNPHNLADHPVAALVASVFVVPGNLMPNLAIVAVSFAVLERAIGPWRTLLVAASAQVGATLLTEYGIEVGARWHLLSAAPADRADVGVSYAMYAVLAAAVLTLPARARSAALAAVALSVVLPFLASPDMTSTGHVLSVAIGAAVMTASASRRRRRRPAEIVRPDRSGVGPACLLPR